MSRRHTHRAHRSCTTCSSATSRTGCVAAPAALHSLAGCRINQLSLVNICLSIIRQCAGVCAIRLRAQSRRADAQEALKFLDNIKSKACRAAAALAPDCSGRSSKTPRHSSR